MDKLDKIFPEQYKALSQRNKILLAIVACLFLIIILTITALGVSYNRCKMEPHFRIESRKDLLSLESHACMDLSCLKASASVQDNMNQTFDPCTDFYSFACGGFVTRNPVRPEDEEISILNLVKLRSDNQLWRTLEVSDLEPPRNDTANYERYSKSAVRKLRDFYSMCVDDYQRTKEGVTGLYKLMNEAMPTLYWRDGEKIGNWTSMAEDLAKVKNELLVDVFFEAYRNFPGSIMLTESTDSLENTQTKEGRTKGNIAFRGLLDTVFTELMSASRRSVVPERRLNFIEDIYKLNLLFEQNVALNESEDGTPSQYQSRRSDTRDNFFAANDGWFKNISLDSLQKNVIKINMLKLLQLQLPDENITADIQVNVDSPQYIYKLAEVFEGVETNVTKLRMINNYMVFQIVRKHASELSWKLKEAFNNYNRISGYRPYHYLQREPSWRRCLYYAQTYMSSVFLHEKVQLVYSDRSLDMVKEMFAKLIDNFQVRVKSFDWIDEKTKIQINHRISGMTATGLSSVYENETYVDNLYKDLVINTSESYIVNLINLLRVQTKIDTSNMPRNYELGVNINLANSRHSKQHDFYITYTIYSNDLFIPIDYIGEPLFDSASPQLFNYGALGFLLASEMMSALLSPYAFQGRMEENWSSETIKNFENLEGCLYHYFSVNSLPTMDAYHSMELKSYRINQIMKHFGGMRLAYQTYEEVLKNKFEKMPIDLLGFTYEQLFFIVSAQTMCSVRGENSDSMTYKLSNSELLNTMAAHFPEFGSAFNCPNGSKMKQMNECQKF